MTELPSYFKLTIGDTFGDGHGRSETFLVRSNYPVDYVRNAHYKIRKATGVDIEDICSEYGEDEIDEESVKKLEELGCLFENSSGMGPGIVTAEEMARIWLLLLERAAPELKLEIVKDEIPEFHFTGKDASGRHIGSVGYGLF